MKSVSIIRSRGQLTIPDSIRKIAKWTSPMSAVSVTIVNPCEIIIKPQEAQLDWDDIWTGIEKVRAIKGKGTTVSTVEFLQRDRVSR